MWWSELSELSELSDGFRTFVKLFDSANTWSQAKKLSNFQTFGLSELSGSFQTFGDLSGSAFGLSDRGSESKTGIIDRYMIILTQPKKSSFYQQRVNRFSLR